MCGSFGTWPAPSDTLLQGKFACEQLPTHQDGPLERACSQRSRSTLPRVGKGTEPVKRRLRMQWAPVSLLRACPSRDWSVLATRLWGSTTPF